MARPRTLMESNRLSLADKNIRLSSGGISLAAKLTILARNAPLVIFAHGFAGDMDEKGLFVGARDFFAGKGFSVLRFDFRGCGGSGGDFRSIRLDDLAVDLTNVIKFVRSSNAMEPRTIGLVSFSLGAGIAILANPANIGAHVFWSPAVYTNRDMAPRYRTREIDNQIAQQGWFNKAGQKIGQQFLESLNSSRIEHSLTRFRHPTLVVHGRNDERIPPRSSETLIRSLSASSKLLLIPDADHSFRSQPSQREWLFSATAAWLDKRLRKPQVSPNQSHLFPSETEDSASTQPR